jgi:dTDP-4-dehydrorhamnose 3,5-epimerase
MPDYSEQILKKTSIEGLYVIERPVVDDERGFFKEFVRIDQLNKDLNMEFVGRQWNHSNNLPNTLRGIHAESWNKIIYPITGNVFLAIIDIRPDSVTFSKVETFVSDKNNRFALFISKGLANSFCNFGVTDSDYLYLVDSYYDGSDKKAIAWDDPDLNIKWPVKNPILSDRDKNNKTLREIFPQKFKI